MLDGAGNPTTDARAATEGAIAPFGGAKGYGLGLAFEVLVASLSGSAVGGDVRGTLDSEHPANKGDVFIVMEPRGGTAELVSEFLDSVRRSPPADPQFPVRIPGDRAASQRRRALAGDIELPPRLWAQIRELAA